MRSRSAGKVSAATANGLKAFIRAVNQILGPPGSLSLFWPVGLMFALQIVIWWSVIFRGLFLVELA